jgi:hypothetical protein
LVESPIRKPPSAVAATPRGELSWAAVAAPPSPADPPVPVPATVVIVPPGDTRRTRWLPRSAIRKPPSAVAATPAGEVSWAAVAALPSPADPAVPVPATVVIVPPGDTRRTRRLF